MARAKKNHHASYPQTTRINTKINVFRVLEFVGKPLFHLLTYLLFALIYLYHYFKTLSQNINLGLTNPKNKDKKANSINISISKFLSFFINYYTRSKSISLLAIGGLFANAKILIFKTKQHIATLLPNYTSITNNYTISFLNRFLATKHKTIMKKSGFKKSKSNVDFVFYIKIIKLKLCLKFIKFGLFLRGPKNTTYVRTPKYGTYFILLAIFLIPIITGVIYFKNFLSDLPSPEDLRTRRVPVSTKIYDRNGVLLYKLFRDENRTPIKFEDIPNHVILATLAIEDSDFYSHQGFSIRGITRAFITNIREGKLTGGSTITQQLVKNTLLTSEKTVSRKVKEIILAIQVENIFQKNEILEMYLNEVSYGGTAYGIQEAAQMFFGKKVNELTIAESALLAGLPKSPSTNSPFGKNPDAAIERQKYVLKLMVENGYITEDQRIKSENEKITFLDNKTEIKAPHFVMYVVDHLKNIYGGDVVEQGGLNVTTTLDWEIQKLTDEVVKSEIDTLSRMNVGNGAAVVINPQTGEILAMTGSRDYFDVDGDGNVNVTTSLRQPGSSIKVINYAYALGNGLRASTIISDTPISFSVQGQPDYSPKNYDGGFRGNITLRSALAESRNVPAVKTLEKFGVQNMIALGKKMGISSWTDPKNYGLSLTLGGGEVKLLDMAQVYSTLANYGIKKEITPVRSITNYKGIVIDDKFNDIPDPLLANEPFAVLADTTERKEENVVLDPRIAFIITDILKDNSSRSPAFGVNSLLNVKGHPEVAVKTGTSNELRDNLAIGYTKDYVVAVWVGNNDSTPMNRIASGVTGATPIFNKIMTALLENKESYNWTIPNGIVRVDTCSLTGTLPCSGCPTKAEWFLEENQPEACTYKVVQVDSSKKKR